MGTIYEWKAGDTFALIALKYRRGDQWKELLDLNKNMLSRNGYIMKPGDLIAVPDDWFPLPNYSFGIPKYRGMSITGSRQ